MQPQLVCIPVLSEKVRLRHGGPPLLPKIRNFERISQSWNPAYIQRVIGPQQPSLMLLRCIKYPLTDPMALNMRWFLTLIFQNQIPPLMEIRQRQAARYKDVSLIHVQNHHNLLSICCTLCVNSVSLHTALVIWMKSYWANYLVHSKDQDKDIKVST